MTTKVTNVYNLKLTPSQFGQNSIVVNCSQYDSLFRVIQFNLFNGNAIYSIPEGSVVTIRGTKKDNTGFEYECDYSNNVVTFPLQQQITIFPGKVPSELRITKEGEIIGSWNFLFLVEESPLSDETTISETQLPLLEQAIEAAGRLNEAFDDIAEFTDETYPNAVQTIQSEGATQVSNVTNEGATQRGLVSSEGATQIANVQAEGTTQKGLVAAEGTTQVGNVQAKGTEVLDSIPSDYTELSRALENEYGKIAVLEPIEPPNKSGSNRVFFYLYQNPGTYIATNDSDMWVSVQGWDSPAFNGNNPYNTGKIYDLPYVFTIDPQSTGLYYRVVFGVDSGSITDDMRLNSTVSKLTRYDDTIEVEVKSKNNSNILNNILAIAHGGTTDFPANNLEMYKEMYKKGIKYWECDVRKCLDGFVLCHDDDIYNHAITASGETIAQGTVSIANSTVAQLQQYKFSVITNKQADGAVPGYENTTIPTLQEFIYLAKALGAIPVFEIKFNATLEDVANICNIVKSHGMFNQSYFFTYGWAQRIAGYLCENGVKRLVISVDGADQQTAIDTAYGYISSYADQFDDLVYDIDDGNYTILTPQLCSYAASKGFRIVVYGIYNTTKLEQIIGAYEKGCSGYMTNLFNPVPIIQNYYLGI